MEGNVQRVIFLFKQYSQQMSYLLGRSFAQAVGKGIDPEVKRIARTQLMGILGGHFMVAGAMGLPVIGVVGGVLEALVNAIGDDDDPWDWETEFRNLLADTLGTTGGELMAHGPARLLPVDISSRVSLSDLWFRGNDRELEGRDAFSSYLETMLGPVTRIGSDFFAGMKAFADGDKIRGLELMLPKALRDIIKSGRYATEGVEAWNKEKIIDGLGWLELSGQLLGFTPSNVAEMYEGKSAIKNREKTLDLRRQRIINQYVNSLREKDIDRKKESMAMIRHWNKKNPTMAITNDTLIRSRRAKGRLKAQTKRGVYLRKGKEVLRGTGRFANMED
jgi:hypothetical protein